MEGAVGHLHHDRELATLLVPKLWRGANDFMNLMEEQNIQEQLKNAVVSPDKGAKQFTNKRKRGQLQNKTELRLKLRAASSVIED